MILHDSNSTPPIVTKKHVDVTASIMSRPSSTLDEEPFLINSPVEAQESDASSDDEDNRAVSVNKRFNEIIRDIKNGNLDPCDAAVLEHFAAQNASYLGQKMTGDNDHNTLLHLLVGEAKDKVIGKYKPLVKLLIDRHPGLLGEKDINEKNPLYLAISKKRDKLVRFMCDTHPDIDAILSIPCCHSENCLHVAIQKDTPKLADFLIKHAGERTLCAKDDKGNTPLHLAVDYKRCIDAQLEIVKALIVQCDKAMDERSNAPNYFSPYRYHEHTRTEAKKAAKEKEKESAQRKKDEGSAAGGNGPGGKNAMDVKSKFVTQARDMKTPEPVVGPKEQGAEVDKTERSVNMSNEAPLRKYGSAGGNFGGSGVMEGGGYKSPELRMGATGMGGLGSSNGKGSNPKTPEVSMTSRRKEREKEEVKVTEESAGVVRNYLKLHYMRTRDHDTTVDFLYGRSQGKSLPFESPSPPSQPNPCTDRY